MEPLFASQRTEARVLALQPGKPALYQMPTPNAENENSAIILAYQVRSSYNHGIPLPYCTHFGARLLVSLALSSVAKQIYARPRS